MRLNLLLSFTALFTSIYVNGQLIISEYLEGASNDKCIEIYNTTNSAINLSGYSLEFYFNGSSSSGNSVPLSGTIAACGTWVVCDNDANAGLISVADQTDNGSFFNGDDAIALYNGATLLDLVGNIGEDPGNEWTGVGGGTENDGFIRNSSYCTGVTSDPSSGFPSFTSSNWTSVGQSGATLGTHSSSCCSSETITIDAVSSLSYSVDCSTGATGSVDITSTGTFNSGNNYIVEMSDASGSFSSATTIGSLASTSNSETISFTIPAGTPTGSGYRIRIVSDDPPVTSSDNGNDISITLTGTCIPPHLTSVIINSCNATCTEGVNELVFGSTGDYSILVNESNFNFSYTNSGALNNYTDNLTSNATVTQELNDECASSNPFIDAYGTTIPPNSSWVLANDAICATDALVWSGLCNSGPIYVIYSTDSDWNSGGNFSNDPTVANPLRPYQTSMTTTSGQTFTIDYETDGSQYPDNDGVFATFDSDGGPATTYGDNDCSFDPLVLPVELSAFEGTTIDKNNFLFWTTESEFEASHFIIERTNDGDDWEYIGELSAAGNSSQQLNYQLSDNRFPSDINIYRLRQVDYDGTELVFSVYVSIDNRDNKGVDLIGIFNLMGQRVDENYKGLQIYKYSDGSSKKVLTP